MIQENFIKLYEHSFRENWDLPCYTDYGENESYTYGEVAQEIAKLHLLFKHCSLRRGDKIAVIGKNNARWCIAYMATITYGGIVVPILQDFNPNDVHHIVNHSESVFLFTSDSIWEHLEEERLTGLRGVFSLNDFRCLYQRDGETIQRFLKHLDNEMHKTYPKGFRQEDVVYTDLSNDKVMLLNYTSGTTGFSKGVMLTGNNLAGNRSSARNSQVASAIQALQPAPRRQNSGYRQKQRPLVHCIYGHHHLRRHRSAHLAGFQSQ